MGTVTDNAGIKRFGKPHLTVARRAADAEPSSPPYWTVIGTICRDRRGTVRNDAAFAWLEEANAPFWRWVAEAVSE